MHRLVTCTVALALVLAASVGAAFPSERVHSRTWAKSQPWMVFNLPGNPNWQYVWVHVSNRYHQSVRTTSQLLYISLPTGFCTAGVLSEPGG
jgi:hypothetical protein